MRGLSIAQMQQVEIAKALDGMRVMIMDELTGLQKRNRCALHIIRK